MAEDHGAPEAGQLPRVASCIVAIVRSPSHHERQLQKTQTERLKQTHEITLSSTRRVIINLMNNMKP